jgi:hypothetical protein
MSASDDVPYFSRFVVKFIEILAAGLATAVSGYLIAHLAGALSSSTPAAVGTATQVAPTVGGVSSTPSVNPAPASADASEQHPAPQEANAPADAQPAPGTESSHGDTGKAIVVPKRLETDKHLEAEKHLEADTSAAASAGESKRDQAENKRAQDAVLARIRAALAKSKARPPDASQPAGNGPRPAAIIGSQRPPVDKRPSAASVTLASPNSANPPPPIQQQVQPSVQQQVPPPVQQQVQPPVQQPPVQPTVQQQAQPPIQRQVQPTTQQQLPTEPTPLTTVEIPSRPVATVQPAPVPAPTSQDDSGMFSGLDRLRHDPLATSDDAPRPPMPVGQ